MLEAFGSPEQGVSSHILLLFLYFIDFHRYIDNFVDVLNVDQVVKFFRRGNIRNCRYSLESGKLRG